MTGKPGYNVTIEAFVPCDVGNLTDQRGVMDIAKDAYDRLSKHSATITRFTIEMVRAADGLKERHGINLDKLVDTHDANLDAAAAMGGMGEQEPNMCSECGITLGKEEHYPACPHNPNTCPVCHTPGGEHASNCVPCTGYRCQGEGKWDEYRGGHVIKVACPYCSGAGRVLVEDEEKDDG